MQADSLPAEPPGKPKNTGVGSLPLLQGNLLHPGTKTGSPALWADSLPAELTGSISDKSELKKGVSLSGSACGTS